MYQVCSKQYDGMEALVASGVSAGYTGTGWSTSGTSITSTSARPVLVAAARLADGYYTAGLRKIKGPKRSSAIDFRGKQ